MEIERVHVVRLRISRKEEFAFCRPLRQFQRLVGDANALVFLGIDVSLLVSYVRVKSENIKQQAFFGLLDAHVADDVPIRLLLREIPYLCLDYPKQHRSQHKK